MSCAKKFFSLFLPVLALVVAGALVPSAVQAAVVFDGTVNPVLSGDWDSDTNGYVGTSGGTGTALVDDASDLDSKNGYIGDAVGGTMTVDGAGSTWTITACFDENWQQWTDGELHVGNTTGGAGVLNITNGGAVSDRSGYIGHYDTATGAVTVSGSSTWTNDSRLFLGYGDGTATLTVESGGTVTTDGRAYIGRNSSSTVTVGGAGSTFHSTGNTYVGYYGAGLLTVESGGTLLLDVDDGDNSTISIGADAAVDFAGTLKLDLTDVTVDEGLWTLITGDGAMTYESSFDLMTSNDMLFTELSDVWTYTTGLSTWTFSEGTGQLSLSTVPEPGTVALLACGLVGLLAYAWRKRK